MSLTVRWRASTAAFIGIRMAGWHNKNAAPRSRAVPRIPLRKQKSCHNSKLIDRRAYQGYHVAVGSPARPALILLAVCREDKVNYFWQAVKTQRRFVELSEPPSVGALGGDRHSRMMGADLSVGGSVAADSAAPNGQTDPILLPIRPSPRSSSFPMAGKIHNVSAAVEPTPTWKLQAQSQPAAYNLCNATGKHRPRNHSPLEPPARPSTDRHRNTGKAGAYDRNARVPDSVLATRSWIFVCYCPKEEEGISLFGFEPQQFIALQVCARCQQNPIASKIQVWMLDMSVRGVDKFPQPCTRLGHRCDYNPRLSFKDDTPRVVEKMQHLTGQAKGVWDLELLSRLYDSQIARPSRHDYLPPFCRLTNDEDREKKAEFRRPGSYNVIVTPSSLTGLDEYKTTDNDDQTPATAGSKTSKLSSTSFPTADLDNNIITFDDPDTVMLRVFEDNTKKITSPMSPSSRFGLSSSSSLTSPSSSHHFHRADMFMLPSQTTSPPSLTYEITPQDPRDWPLICHYRNLLSRHLFHVHRGTITPPLAPGAFFTQELFERTVATFPPLYHALMALCALGMAHRSGIQNLDSLQHYQQALPCLQKTLRRPEDLSSDGALLTHFTLLLYEIAAAAPRASNLWSQHVNQLRRIFVLRREMYETEPYSFLLWWVCNIDTHALICGTSDGELVDAMLQYNMFPTADNIFQLNGSGECYDPLIEEAHAMPLVLDFNRKIEVLTCRLGLLRRNLQREAENFARQSRKMSKVDLLERQRRVTDIQQALRRTWNEQMPPYIAVGLRNNTLPTRARGILDNSYVLYHACIIYSHTSMYPNQRSSPLSPYLPSSPPMPHPSNYYTSPPTMHNPSQPYDLAPIHHHEIQTSAHEILSRTRAIISSGHHELRFAVFPLFMAGYVLPRGERHEALTLMGGMEMESIGRNTRATRELLEEVYWRMDEGQRQGEVEVEVDWVRITGPGIGLHDCVKDSSPFLYSGTEAYKECLQTNFNLYYDQHSAVVKGKTVGDLASHLLEEAENEVQVRRDAPQYTVEQFWDMVSRSDVLSPTSPASNDFRRMLGSGKLPLVPLGRLDGAHSLWLIPALGSLPATKPDRNVEQQFAATISYPDSHPSESDSVSTVIDEDDQRLRRFVSLGWMVLGTPDRFRKTGHALVVDVEPGQDLHPWIVLASEFQDDEADDDDDDIVVVPKVVDRDAEGEDGVLPGDRNLIPVGKIKAMHNNNSHQKPALRSFEQEFAFTIHRKSAYEPLAYVMDWYLDPVFEEQ
ncbi:MAG: hypothetical protein Q9181_001462, partial [Wetmoreana brouardii]